MNEVLGPPKSASESKTLGQQFPKCVLWGTPQGVADHKQQDSVNTLQNIVGGSARLAALSGVVSACCKGPVHPESLTGLYSIPCGLQTHMGLAMTSLPVTSRSHERPLQCVEASQEARDWKRVH